MMNYCLKQLPILLSLMVLANGGLTQSVLASDGPEKPSKTVFLPDCGGPARSAESTKILEPISIRNLGSSTLAQDENEKDLIISEFRIEGYRKHISDHEILNSFKVKPGDKFDRYKIQSDLRSLSMGSFDSQSLLAVPELSAAGLLLKIQVKENSVLTDLAFAGNTVFADETLKQAFSKQIGKPQNLNALSRSLDTIEQWYHEKGYRLAQCDELTGLPEGKLQIRINEGVINAVELKGSAGDKAKLQGFIARTLAQLPYNENIKEQVARISSEYKVCLFRLPTNPTRYKLTIGIIPDDLHSHSCLNHDNRPGPLFRSRVP